MKIIEFIVPLILLTIFMA